MKKIYKLLTSLTSLPILCTSLIPLTNCSCNKTEYFSITVSASDGITIIGKTTLTVAKNTKWKDIKPQVIFDESKIIGYGWYDISAETPVLVDDELEITSNCNFKYVGFNTSANLCKVIFRTDTKTYDPIYGIQDATFKEFKEYYEIEVPVKEKHIFDGWYVDGTKIDEETYKLPEGDMPTLTVDVVYHLDFLNDTWKNLCEQSSKGLDHLKTYYELDTFVGLQKTITLNGLVHNVRVIGEDHDALANGSGNAALTFELVQLLSSSAGQWLPARWDATNNRDYINSTFRKNLTGQGNATSYLWETTGLAMLKEGNIDLFNGLKEVTKSVAIGSGYTVTTYNDKLFPLTYTEMAQTDFTHAKAGEGKPYEYWTNHNNDVDRQRYAVSSKARHHYWLGSAYIDDETNAYIVGNAGSFGKDIAYYTSGVTFAFCI